MDIDGLKGRSLVPFPQKCLTLLFAQIKFHHHGNVDHSIKQDLQDLYKHSKVEFHFQGRFYFFLHRSLILNVPQYPFLMPNRIYPPLLSRTNTNRKRYIGKMKSEKKKQATSTDQWNSAQNGPAEIKTKPECFSFDVIYWSERLWAWWASQSHRGQQHLRHSASLTNKSPAEKKLHLTTKAFRSDLV